MMTVLLASVLLITCGSSGEVGAGAPEAARRADGAAQHGAPSRDAARPAEGATTAAPGDPLGSTDGAGGGEPVGDASTAATAAPPSATSPGPWPPAEERRPAPAVQDAVALLEEGDAAAAVAALDSFLAEHPDDADALRWRGAARARLEPPDAAGAEADLLRAVQRDPGFSGARIALCDLWIPQKRCVDALPHLTWLVEHHPDLADAWSNRAFCRLSTHDWRGGVADAERACQLGHARSCEMLPRLRIRLENEEAGTAAPTSTAPTSTAPTSTAPSPGAGASTSAP